mgnify:CR=1 FL=1
MGESTNDQKRKIGFKKTVILLTIIMRKEIKTFTHQPVIYCHNLNHNMLFMMASLKGVLINNQMQYKQL